MTHLSGDEAGVKSATTPQCISLILPAWNEEDALPRAIAKAESALRAITTDYEIIVVDDGSRDGTAECVESLAAGRPAVRLLRHEENRGYGAALRTGFAAARCDLVVFTDADVQFDLRELSRFALLAENYEVVCGYRIDRKDSPLRCFYSRVYNHLVRALLRTGVRDVDCAFKMFHRETLQHLTITSNGFLVNSELLTRLRQRGGSVVEVGVTHRPRIEGQSTVSIWHIPVVLSALIRFWWNHVQFPGPEEAASQAPPADSEDSVSDKRLLWLQAVLFAVAALLLLTGLSYPLIDRDETRYAEIPREMLESGDWLVPRLNFRTYYDKPALLYWLCAASYSVFGVAESSARLVPALCGLVTLAATMWFGNRAFGSRVGLLSGVVLLLSVGFLGASRILLIDGLLACCVTLSLVTAYEAIRTGSLRLGWWLCAAVACGLGFLAKGPVALVLFIPPVFALGWLSHRTTLPSVGHWLLHGGIVAAIAAPWFIAVESRAPGFAYEFFYRHNIERFGGAFHAKPFWFFLPVALIGGHPWSFITIPCLDYLTSGAKRIREQRTPAMGFLALWSLWCLAFFTMSRCKLPPYILPAAPAMALLFGKYLDNLLWSGDQSWWSHYAKRWAPWLATGTTCVVGVSFAALGHVGGHETTPHGWLVIVALFAALGTVVVLCKYINSPFVGWGVCAGSTLIVGSIVLHREIPRYAAAETVFGPNSPLVAEVPEATNAPVVTVGHEWSGIPFDLRRNDIRNYDRIDPQVLTDYAAENGNLLVVVCRNDAACLLQSGLPAHTHLTNLAERGPARLMLLETEVETATADRPDKKRGKKR